MVNQSPFLNRPPIMQGLLQGIEHKVCLGRPRDPPSDDAISERVDERDLVRHWFKNNGRAAT
jgi:hypothetical protein